jgi:hypothetical protein
VVQGQDFMAHPLYIHTVVIFFWEPFSQLAACSATHVDVNRICSHMATLAISLHLISFSSRMFVVMSVVSIHCVSVAPWWDTVLNNAYLLLWITLQGRYLNIKNLHVIHQNPWHDQKVGVWCGVNTRSVFMTQLIWNSMWRKFWNPSLKKKV